MIAVMKSRVILLAFLGAILLIGCSDDDASGPLDSSPTGSLQIRVRNDSARDFDGVVVGFPIETIDYGAVSSGQASDYQVVAVAHAYARIDVFLDDESLRIQPFDYIGEPTLSPGLFTYAIEIFEGELNLTLIED
jgi:hypothetical protein